MTLVQAGIAATPATIATATAVANLPPMPPAPQPLSGMAFADHPDMP